MARDTQYDLIIELLKQRNWLYIGEIELIESFAKRLTDRKLSEKQSALLPKIRERIQRRKMTKIVPGGGPGSGKRR